MKRVVLFSLMLGFAADSVVTGAEVSFSRADFRVSPDAAADGAPENGHVADFFVTTDADILSIGEVQIDVQGGEAYNVECTGLSCSLFARPPLFPFIFNPRETADTWVTTPGSTALLGADFPGDGDTTTLGDLSNDGPQNHFQFARITVPDRAIGTFSGRITVAGATAPESFPFSFALGIPEPSSFILMSLGALAAVNVRNRRGH